MILTFVPLSTSIVLLPHLFPLQWFYLVPLPLFTLMVFTLVYLFSSVAPMYIPLLALIFFPLVLLTKCTYLFLQVAIILSTRLAAGHQLRPASWVSLSRMRFQTKIRYEILIIIVSYNFNSFGELIYSTPLRWPTQMRSQPNSGNKEPISDACKSCMMSLLLRERANQKGGYSMARLKRHDVVIIKIIFSFNM